MANETYDFLNPMNQTTPASGDVKKLSCCVLALSGLLFGIVLIDPATPLSVAGDTMTDHQDSVSGPAAFDLPDVTGNLSSADQSASMKRETIMDPAAPKAPPPRPVYRSGHKADQTRHPSLPPVEMPVPLPRPKVDAVQETQ